MEIGPLQEIWVSKHPCIREAADLSLLSGFPVNSMPATEPTVFLKFKSIRRIASILSSCIVLLVAFLFSAGQYNNISHSQKSYPHTDQPGAVYYSMTSEMEPAPTVTRPSLIANRNCGSMAMGLPSSTSTVTLSPGITICTPSGRVAVPVTSVVLK